MYCPKFATQSSDDTKYCRSCGSNLSLVPLALTGRLPTEPSRRRHRRDFEHGGPPTLAKGITKAFMGVGFLLVSFACFFFAPAGRIWWFWMLIPALGAIGSGVGECLSFRSKQQHFILPVGPPRAVTPQPRPPEIQASTPSESSVTEHTTRHL